MKNLELFARSTQVALVAHVTLVTLVTLVALVPWGSASFALAQETQIRGFVDAAVFFDFASPNAEFGLDQVEIDVEHQASEKTSLRADLEWVRDGATHVAQIEQGYMTYAPRAGWAFGLGKFNAPIGFELLDAPDMYQYSHSLVFDFGLPTNLTGLFVTRDLGRGVDLVAHVSNGWDRETAGPNFTYGGRLGFTRGGFGGGVSAISGREEFDSEDASPTALTRTVFDVDLSYLTGAWRFGGEVNLGSAESTGEIESDWVGFLVMTHVEFDAGFGLTLRYDAFDDRDGFAFGVVEGESQFRQSITFAPTFALDEGFGAFVELRVDLSDQDAFADRDGEAVASSTFAAFEMTYAW